MSYEYEHGLLAKHRLEQWQERSEFTFTPEPILLHIEGHDRTR